MPYDPSDPSRDFDPISLSGTILLKGADGRTCEIDIEEIVLDRGDPSRLSIDVTHRPVYSGPLTFQKCVANLVDGYTVRIKIDPSTGEKLFTATFRPPQET